MLIDWIMWRLALRRLHRRFYAEGRLGRFNFTVEGNARWRLYMKRLRWMANIGYGMGFTENREWDDAFCKPEAREEKVGEVVAPRPTIE